LCPNFDLPIRCLQHTHFNSEARLLQVALHLLTLKEHSFQRDRLAPSFLYMPLLLARVEGKQKQPIGSEHTVQLVQDWDHLWAREMDQGVEGHDAEWGKVTPSFSEEGIRDIDN
jgi:hypothetical protein